MNAAERKFAAQVRNKVSYAIQRGDLVRRPCEVCGKTKNIDAHHDDYTKPFAVRWLCKAHHKLHHLEAGDVRRPSRRGEKYSRNNAQFDPLIIECARNRDITETAMRQWRRRGVPHHFRCHVAAVAERLGLPVPAFVIPSELRGAA